MRACEGCRRRKIKCDAATTNTWPCSACVRLKLHCVPPSVNYDRDFVSNPQAYETEREYEGGGSGDDDYHHHISMQQHLGGGSKSVPPIYTQQMPYPEHVGVYQSVPYEEPPSSHSQQSIHYGNLQTPVSAIDQHQHAQQQQHSRYQPQQVFHTPPIAHPSSPDSYDRDQYGQQNISDLLGELKMNEAGTGTVLLHSHQIRRSNRFQLHIWTTKVKPKHYSKSPPLKKLMNINIPSLPPYLVQTWR